MQAMAEVSQSRMLYASSNFRYFILHLKYVYFKSQFVCNSIQTILGVEKMPQEENDCVDACQQAQLVISHELLLNPLTKSHSVLPARDEVLLFSFAFTPDKFLQLFFAKQKGAH